MNPAHTTTGAPEQGLLSSVTPTLLALHATLAQLNQQLQTERDLAYELWHQSGMLDAHGTPVSWLHSMALDQSDDPSSVSVHEPQNGAAAHMPVVSYWLLPTSRRTHRRTMDPSTREEGVGQGTSPSQGLWPSPHCRA